MTNDAMTKILKSNLNQNEKLILLSLGIIGDQTQAEMSQNLKLHKSGINKCVENLRTLGFIGSEMPQTQCGRPTTKWMFNFPPEDDADV